MKRVIGIQVLQVDQSSNNKRYPIDLMPGEFVAQPREEVV